MQRRDILAISAMARFAAARRRIVRVLPRLERNAVPRRHLAATHEIVDRHATSSASTGLPERLMTGVMVRLPDTSDFVALSSPWSFAVSIRP